MTLLLLRSASIVALLQGLAHTFLIVSATPKHGPDEIAVVSAMKAHRFDFLGSLRSYWDFYFGYALFVALTCGVEAVLFWQLAAVAAAQPALARPMIALFCGANIGFALLAAKYFFLTPIVPDVIIAVCLGAALVTA
jgi:hypothetical protein